MSEQSNIRTSLNIRIQLLQEPKWRKPKTGSKMASIAESLDIINQVVDKSYFCLNIW